MNDLVQRDVTSTKVLGKIVANETDNESYAWCPIIFINCSTISGDDICRDHFRIVTPNLALGNSQWSPQALFFGIHDLMTKQEMGMRMRAERHNKAMII